ADAMFADEYGRPPADARERSGFLARVSRQATTAVAGYDLTFSPVKSVSALWAIAPLPVARAIEQAHQAAVADTIAWLEDHAVYTRTGRNGVAQVDVTGLIAAAFTHRDSRAGDPDLHTHVAISNKVLTLAGRWLALDGRPLHKAAVAASERYNTRLEAHLVDSLEVTFAARPGGDPSKRPVRELVGIDDRLLALWSTRRAAIDVRRGQLASQFQTDHGRPPTTVEAIHLAQQATLETRNAKHEPRSHAEQRNTWRTEAIALLGSEQAVTTLVEATLHPSCRDRTGRRPTGAWAQATAVDVVATVAATRATWQECHIRAEAERRARTDRIRRRDVDAAVNAVVTHALSPRLSVTLRSPDPVTDTLGEPTVLRRRDGSSVYTVAGAQRYTSARILDAERRLLDVAGRRDGRAASQATVELSLLEAAANGVQLNPGQAQLVRDLATSGARLQLALAPAGTGKTTALRALARAWRDSGGHVLGLAPSAAAAAVLRDELDTHTDTLAKLIHSLDSNGPAPEWMTRIGPATLVVIDEAGMAATSDLARIVDHVIGRGASVRLVGDDQQLAAIGAGGILRDIAEVHGAVTLTQVVRFTDMSEGAASLALRTGDPAAIGYYTDHGRLHVGDLSTVTDHAYQAWAADTAAGRDAVMLAPTRELVAGLNIRAHTDRRTGNGTAGATVSLADGSSAGVGDTVITRANDRRLPITATDWVKNGDRWTITHVRTDGALAVTHLATRRHLVLPADYVRTHVALGYATTVHGAQGVTADAPTPSPSAPRPASSSTSRSPAAAPPTIST
ncbi:MAG TPA: MobF family relaxase, partial [Kineosporiaceae bacterium]|nr:MobF family relaxase [Kineosporiaceae bacterium]